MRTIDRVIESEKPLQVLSRRNNMIGFMFLKHRLTPEGSKKTSHLTHVPVWNRGSVDQGVASGMDSSASVSLF